MVEESPMRAIYVVSLLILFVAFTFSLGQFFSQGFFKYLFEKYLDFYKFFKNDFTEASIWVGIVGSITSISIYLYRYIKEVFFSMFLVTMNLHNNDEPFDWVVQYLAEHKDYFKTAQKLKISTKVKKNSSSWKINQSEDEKPEILFHPGEGAHVFEYQGKMIWMTRNEAPELKTTGWDNTPFLFESLNLSMFARNDQVFQSLMREVMEYSLKRVKGETKIYVMGRWGDWVHVITKKAREFDSVILDGNYSEQIYQDAKEFFSRHEWYLNQGIPYRRGYLLFGPPGTGKTSFISALAGKLELDICLLSLSSGEVDDNQLNQKLHEAPKNSIIVLEDIDSIFVDRNTPVNKSDKNVTFAGLLNALDGVGSQEGKLLFMTTNHIEKIDPALIRPGRCDVKIEFKRASKKQLKDLFVRFYKNETQGEEFSLKVQENFLSMAELQGFFLQNSTGEDALKNIGIFLKKSKSENETSLVKLTEWLPRLNLSKYLEKFSKEKYEVLADISEFKNHRSLKGFVDLYGEKERFLKMLKGDKNVVRDFQHVPKESIKHLVETIYKNPKPELVEKFVTKIPEGTKTFFEIRDHLYEHNSVEEALENIDKILEPPKTDIPPESIESWLLRVGFIQYLKEFKDNDVKDVRDLKSLGQDDLEEFGIKKHGHKIKLNYEIEKLSSKNDDKDE